MWLEAQVISIQWRSTPRGQRLYTVFKGVDGSEMGIWTTGNYRNLRNLQLGDTVILKRNSSGCLCLAPLSLSLLARVGLFALRNKYWRLI